MTPEPLTPAQFILARAMTEAELQQAVVQCAEALGWTVAHVRDSRRQKVEGLPDLLMFHPLQRRVLWCELKRLRGIVVPLQEWWLEGLRLCGQEVYLWRPSEWLAGEIEGVLRGDHRGD